MAITQLTNNGFSKSPDISGNDIVWVEDSSDDDLILFDGTTNTVLPDLGFTSITNPQISADGILWNGYTTRWQILFYDGVTTTQLTDTYSVNHEKLSGNRIAWSSSPEYTPTGNLSEVFVYDDSTQTTTQLTDNDNGDGPVDISGDNIVWRGGGIFLNDGVTTTQISSSGNNPHVSGDQVIWTNYSGGQLSEIHLYDGNSTTQIVDANNSITLFGFFDSNVIWSEWDGNDWELFRFDGSNTSQITDNDFNDVFSPNSTSTSRSYSSSAVPDGSGDNLVWSSYVDDNWEVFFYDGSQTIQVTDNDIDDLDPKISGDRVVWNTREFISNSSVYDVFLFEPDPLPDPVAFEDDFDPEIDNSQWQEISNGIANTNFGGSGNSLFFTGGTGGNSRFATSKTLDLTDGGFISFDLIFGTSSNGGENADFGEDVVLEYSINDGTTWTNLALYDTEDYTSWSTLAEAIPATAQTESTLLRWRQVRHSGSSFDNWGLDNVELVDAGTNFAPSGTDESFSLAENSPNNTVVGTVIASDPNPGQVLDYSIQSGNDAGAFAIDSTGQITVIDSVPLDYETTPSFALEIEVSDNGSPVLSDTVLISVDLVDVYEGPVLSTITDDFDPDIDNSQWSNVGNGSANTNFGGSGNSLFFTGGNSQDSSRYLTTVGVNVANGGNISFDLIFGTSSNGGENADAGEDVVLEYSINSGATWVEIDLYDTEAYTSWTGISESVPVDAQTDETLFRWSQVRHSGSNFDNWGLDNILIDTL